MNTWGHSFRLSIFGESHGTAIGVVLDGLPLGFAPDMQAVAAEMARRRGGGELATPRAEEDAVELLSGLFDGKTTGAPLCAVIHNKNTRSGDYAQNLPRPGHADFTAHVKYKGFSDYRGGGHFSGRLTAPLVFAGAVAKQLLKKRGVVITAGMVSVGGADASKHRETILSAKDDGDSVGGVIKCAAEGLPAGLGEPFFYSVESSLTSLLFSIPAVKGVEFGGGFSLADMRGSEANDAYYMDGETVKTRTNNNGGVNGGITNGMPLEFRVAIKPTPSISKRQQTVDLATGKNADICVGGRHDPCIVPRAVPVVEAVTAICLLDLWLTGGSAL